MGIVKSIQYSIYCENYWLDETPELSCNQFEDFAEHKSPQAEFKKMGYRKINGKWYCKDCATQLLTTALGVEMNVEI